MRQRMTLVAAFAILLTINFLTTYGAQTVGFSLWQVLLIPISAVSYIVMMVLIWICMYLDYKREGGFLKYKRITREGRGFLYRINFYLKSGSSIKIHFFNMDDIGTHPHNHPWNFDSLLIIPYKEEMYIGDGVYTFTKRHSILTLVSKSYKDFHKVKLYRVVGVKIPALTIGIYSSKRDNWNFSHYKEIT